MAMSSIYLPPTARRLPDVIGGELRRRRLEAGLSQAAVAAPFTRALVCAIEHGRAVPSITTLAVFLDHLELDFDEFFRGVQSQLTMVYDREDGKARASPPPRRRR